MKKPGEFLLAKKRHQKRQQIRNQLNLLKEGNVVIISAKWCEGNQFQKPEWVKIKVTPFGTPSNYKLYFGIAGRQCQIFFPNDKMGGLFSTQRHYHWNDIDMRGVVLEIVGNDANTKQIRHTLP